MNASLSSRTSIRSLWRRLFSHPEQQTNQSIADYLVLHRLGGGTPKDVYLGRCAGSDSQVVIKTLRSQQPDDLQTIRLKREAEYLGRCKHRNIAKLIAAGTYRELPYLVIEYIPGISLFDFIMRFGRTDDGRAISILVQLCHGLAEIHAQGIVHCDLSPKNIILSKHANQDYIKIIDFGIAHEIGKPSDRHTASSRISGSPAFMSPEACQSPRTITPQSDIYSLGCLAYFLLTARIPFDGATSIEICWKQINAAAPTFPGPVLQSSSPKLREIILQCLAKQAADRPCSVPELSAALENCGPLTAWSMDDAHLWWSKLE
jgi:eukaryotic-like serine/threonine-protein kinase